MRRNTNTVFRRIENTMNDQVFSTESASISGIGIKTLYFIMLTMISGILGIYLMHNNPDILVMLLSVSGVLGFISALVGMNSYRFALPFGSIYSICEGIFLGTVSFIFEEELPGVVLTATLATVAIVFACSFIYLSGLIKVNSKFTKFLLLASISYIITMLSVYLLGMFGLVSLDGFGSSLLVGFITTVLASLFLMNDFEYANQMVESGSPKEVEWMISFGIAYTVIWLYYEILRLVVIIFGNRD